MSGLRNTLRLARDLGAGSLIGRHRRRWAAMVRDRCARWWPGIAGSIDVRLDLRPRTSPTGLMLHGVVSGSDSQREFWIKWRPASDPVAMANTIAFMDWWRAEHPRLAPAAAEMLDHWPDESVLIVQACAGRTLGRTIAEIASPASQEKMHIVTLGVRRLGRWLKAFGAGSDRYGPDITPLLGDQITRADDGTMTVDVPALLEQRLKRTQVAAQRLAAAGLTDAVHWLDRHSPEDVIGSFGRNERAGFIHGDLNHDNVLVDGDDFHVIDWWAAPRVSWSLPDVATLAANLWLLEDCPHAGAVWWAFQEVYFDTTEDERTTRCVDFLGTMMCVQLLASKVSSGHLQSAVDRRWCRRTLSRLVDPRTMIGRPARPGARKLEKALP